jgi:hypothetical protein
VQGSRLCDPAVNADVKFASTQNRVIKYVQHAEYFLECSFITALQLSNGIDIVVMTGEPITPWWFMRCVNVLVNGATSE